MPDALESVKALAKNYARWARNSDESDPDKIIRHNATAEALEAVVSELEVARKRLRPVPNDFGDLSDLPEEVMAQLNLSKVDELEQQMRDIIVAGNGSEISIDQIIIELYRRHKVIHERKFIMNKLYRMAQKGLVESVDGKKGVYCVPHNTGGNWGAVSKGYSDLDDDIPF